MRIHYLQHVPFEDLAMIESWAKSKGYPVTVTRLYETETFKLNGFPALDEFDWLFVMGGPMNIYEHSDYPWLPEEKTFIRSAIDGGKVTVGICLGAQLIADVLGGKVVKNLNKEIGWYPVEFTEEGKKSLLFRGFPPSETVFHWHGDTFNLPQGAQLLASSQATVNQAFSYEDGIRKAVGLQFHIEYSSESIEKMLFHCADELVTAPFIQSDDDIRANLRQAVLINRLLQLFLENMTQEWGK